MAGDDTKKSSSGHLSEELEEDMSQLPNMNIAHLHFLLQVSSSANAAVTPKEIQDTKASLLEHIETNSRHIYIDHHH
jgi:hypothetical protein